MSLRLCAVAFLLPSLRLGVGSGGPVTPPAGSSAMACAAATSATAACEGEAAAMESLSLLQLRRQNPGGAAQEVQGGGTWLTRSWPWPTPQGWWDAASGDDGAAVLLNYVRSSDVKFYGMAAPLGLPGVTSAPQQALLDLGSPLIAFCDSSLAAAVAAQNTGYAQCHTYGSVYPASGCGAAEGGFLEYFYGSVYRGDVQVFSGQGDVAPATLPQVYYAVIDESGWMTCQYGFDAIWGVAFGANSATRVPGGNASALLHQCDATPNGPLVQCSSGDFETTVFPSPIMQAMKAASMQRFGLFVDYRSAIAAGPGTHEDLGVLYVGKAATENPFYTHSTSQVTFTTYGRSLGVTQFYWDFLPGGWEVTSAPGGEIVSKGPFHSPQMCGNGDGCLFDSGNPSVVIPENVFAACTSAFEASPNATLNFLLYKDYKVYGRNSIVTLSMPVAFLIETHQAGWLSFADQIIFGLPVFQLFYVVFDDDADSITVATLPER